MTRGMRYDTTTSCLIDCKSAKGEWNKLKSQMITIDKFDRGCLSDIVPFCQVDTLDTYGSPLSQVISYFSTTEAPKMQGANDLRVYHPFNSTSHTQPPPPEKPKMYLPNYLDHYLAPQTSKRIKRKPHFKIQRKPQHKARREPRRRRGSSGVGNVR